MFDSAKRRLPAVIVIALLAFAIPAFADDVTISGNVNFSSLDGSSLDHDGTANGTFTVDDGDLTVLGTINCNDSGSGNNSACPMNFVVSGDFLLDSGAAIFAENRNGGGSGGDVSFDVGGNFTVRGTISTSRTSNGNPNTSRAGYITVNADGAVSVETGGVITAASQSDLATKITISAGTGVTVAGAILAGPSSAVSSGTMYTGDVFTGGSNNTSGGDITITASGGGDPSVSITGTGVVATQAEANGPGHVSITACAVDVKGLVASVAKSVSGASVTIVSATTITVDGRDLGTAAARRGMVRADSTQNSATTYSANLYASDAIQVLGPASGSLYAVTSNGGTGTNDGAGTVNVISANAGVTASGRAFSASNNNDGDQGGTINVSAKNNVDLNTASLNASGDFTSTNNNRAGGDINVRSYSGSVTWTNGVGDVRPVGSAAGVPAAQQGTITITHCTGATTTGTSFPTNGAPVGAFPTIVNSCSPAAPTLPGSITLPDCNDPPVAVNDMHSVAEGGTLNVAAPGVLGNDSDPDGDPITAVLVSGPLHATTFFLNADGSFQYVHDGSETTSDSFTYQASDGSALSNVATVSITITPVNDPPVANNDTATVAEGGTINMAAPGVLANDTDPDGPGLTAVLVTGPLHASFFQLNPDGSYIYTHDGSETTSDSFTYQASDGSALSNVATVSITITPVNDAPVANNDTYSVDEGGTLTVGPPGVLGNDTDADGPGLTAVLVTGPANATFFALNANGGFTYTHNGTSLATDSFTYRANDGTANSNIATVFINIVAQPPTAVDDVYTTVGNTELRVGLAPALTPHVLVSGDVLDNDTDPNTPNSALIVTAFDATSVNGGSVSMDAQGRFSYLPPAGNSATDSFNYTVSDGSSTDTGTVFINFIEQVWYVNQAYAGPSTGRSSQPFTTVSAAQGASAPNDYIHVAAGSYGSGILLKSGQKLIGSGAALIVGPYTLAPATVRPTLGDTIILAANNLVVGLNVNTANSGITGSAVATGTIAAVGVTAGGDGISLTSAVGPFFITDVTIASTGGAGLLINGGTPAITATNIDITTTTGAALQGNAGSLTIAAGSDGSTAATTSGGVIDLSGMTLGVTLRSASSNGGTNGIRLHTTTGSFTVTGTGTTAGSGGTVQNATQRGASLTSAANVTLKNMNFTNNATTQTVSGVTCGSNLVTSDNLACVASIYLQNTTNSAFDGVVVDGSSQIGINGNGVNGFSLTNSEVKNAGNEAFESGLLFQNLSGTVTLTNANIHNNASRQMFVENLAGSMTMSVSGSSLSNSSAATGQQGLLVDLVNSASAIVNVSSSTFSNNGAGNGNAVQINGANSATLNVTIIGSSFQTNAAGIVLAAVGAANLTYDINNNPVFTGNALQAINIFQGVPSTGTVSGKITNNVIGTTGVPGSACQVLSSNCHGIDMIGSGNGTFAATVSGNQIRQVGGFGIAGRANTVAEVMNLKISANTIAEPFGLSPLNAIFVQSGSVGTATTSVCADIIGNSIAGIWDPSASNTAIRVRNRFAGTQFRLPGYAGAGNDTTAVAAFLSGQNGGASASATINANIFGGGAACPTP